MSESPNNALADGTRHPAAAAQAGFTYVDVLIAIGILMTGIVALLSAMTAAIATSGRGQQQLIAKQYATSTMESIFSARDINNPKITSFAVIANDTTAGGLFLTGVQPVYNSTGKDGIIGTADDGWGPDGIQGTPDDLTPVPGFTRTITIAPVSTGVISITVTITCQSMGLTFSETLTSYMANYNTQKFS
jgi:type II secretory pathway pseudopilin PulG